MNSKANLFSLIMFLSIANNSYAQKGVDPVAKFSFNDKKDYDEIGKNKVKFSDASFAEDRFGNDNNAVYLFGNSQSYINLGNYPALKQVSGSISFWVKVENEIWAGKGQKMNPFIITKSSDSDDFYEAYAIGYTPELKKVAAWCSNDSLNQVSVTSIRNFSLFRWHHLVLTYDDNHFTFYVDGEQVKQLKKNFRTRFLQTDSVLVGVSANKKNERSSYISVDDIYFYDRVLQDNEVRDLFNAPNPNKYTVILKWVLIFLVFALVIFLIYLFVRHRLSVTLKREKIRLELANTLLENELRINRALMNPHFIFNCLNTLHNYILTQNIDKASDYLVKFAKLIRKILDSNISDTISLSLEIDLLSMYLEVEGMRFKEDIKQTIVVDPAIIASAITIPVMMLQPFVENSVWHGLRDKAGEKTVSISFTRHENVYLKCIIEDNGVGRKAKKPDASGKKSLAIGFVQHRLGLMNKIHKLKCSMTIIDKPDHKGTIIEIILPILNSLKNEA